VNAARTPRQILEELFRAAFAAVDPVAAVRAAVRVQGGTLQIAGECVPPRARLRVLAAGKAAAGMAAALEEIAGDRIVGGLVVTKVGHGRELRRLALRESAHPVPDERSEAAGRALLACAAEGSADEIMIVLLSGGASALLACPLPGLARDDVVRTTELLLASGAAIEELNCVRKHVCDVSGGRLARAARGRTLLLLAISDVIGDRLDVIGSGPCSADPTRYGDALDVLRARGVLAAVPPAVRAHLEAGARGERPESPKPDDACFAHVRAEIVASNRDALRAAKLEAERLGLRAVELEGWLRGEAREAGRRLAGIAHASRVARPTVILAGGETTVTLRGSGRGGRNSELALAAAIDLAGHDGATLLAAGTDGTDGPTDAAGACADGATVARGRARGLDAAAALAANDSYAFFAAEGGLLRTGPTGTNVMDLALLHVVGGSA
jgi:glycerate-2-kinase